MSNILTEVSRETKVVATATNGSYQYEVNYTYTQSDGLLSVQCNIYKTVEGSRQYMGYMAQNGGVMNKSFNPPADQDVVSHVTQFSAIVAEIETLVNPEE